MPELQRSADGSVALAKAVEDGREVAYRLAREGVLFLVEILGVRDGDTFRPSDLQLLKDRGWATLEEPQPIREPEPRPEPPPIGTPRSDPESVSLGEPEPSRDLPAEKEFQVPSAPVPPVSKKAQRRASRAVKPSARNTRGREVALQVLYQADQNPDSDPANLDRFLAGRVHDEKVRAYARELVAGVRRHRDLIDERIGVVAENWRLDRMAAIDRNILRLASFEMIFRPDIPRKVAINEALELAKRYSTAQSSRFVNGVLDRLDQSVPGSDQEAAETAPSTPPMDRADAGPGKFEDVRPSDPD